MESVGCLGDRDLRQSDLLSYHQLHRQGLFDVTLHSPNHILGFLNLLRGNLSYPALPI